MSKDFFVLRGGRVVYAPGHYDVEGARKTALMEAKQHPRSVVKVVQLVDAIQDPHEPAAKLIPCPRVSMTRGDCMGHLFIDEDGFTRCNKCDGLFGPISKRK